MLWLLYLVFEVVSVVSCQSRPNILFVLSDDLGWGEPGLFPATSPHGRISTPNLDKFGKEGMIFMDAYAGYTVCAPSRTTFMTGYHSGHFAAHHLNINNSTYFPTVADLLQKAGYATACFGKCTPLMQPTNHGFGDFLGESDQTRCHNMYPTKLMPDTPYEVSLPLNNKLLRDRETCMAAPSRWNYTTDVFADAAYAWLEKHAGGSTPFFAYLAFTVPHAGGWSEIGLETGQPVPSDLQYGNTSWRDVERDHAASVTYMDARIGQVLQLLKTKGVDSNTVVVFASDNGAHNEGGHSHLFFNSTGGLRGFKRSYYEGGVRSPSMIRWPGVVPAGSSSSYVWALWDLYATFAELGGAASRVPPGTDSTSIVNVLKGKSQAPKPYVYFTWHGNVGLRKGPGFGVRIGDLKGVVPACRASKPSMEDATDFEVYDLSVDPFETTNLHASHGEFIHSTLQMLIKEDVSCQCYQC